MFQSKEINHENNNLFYKLVISS